MTEINQDQMILWILNKMDERGFDADYDSVNAVLDLEMEYLHSKGLDEFNN